MVLHSRTLKTSKGRVHHLSGLRDLLGKIFFHHFERELST